MVDDGSCCRGVDRHRGLRRLVGRGDPRRASRGLVGTPWTVPGGNLVRWPGGVGCPSCDHPPQERTNRRRRGAGWRLRSCASIRRVACEYPSASDPPRRARPGTVVLTGRGSSPTGPTPDAASLHHPTHHSPRIPSRRPWTRTPWSGRRVPGAVSAGLRRGRWQKGGEFPASALHGRHSRTGPPPSGRAARSRGLRGRVGV